MGRHKKVPWRAGDIFIVPLSDGAFGIGQILIGERDALESVLCAFVSDKLIGGFPTHPLPIKEETTISVLFIPREPFDSGAWKIVSHSIPLDAEHFVPRDALRSKGFVGARITGWKTVAEFLNAYHRLRNWDDYWHTADYFDSLLVSPDKKPTDVLLSSARKGYATDRK